MDSAVRSSKLEKAMITITTANKTEQQFAEAAMAQEVLRNPNLNGAEYKVVIGDEWERGIDGADELVGAALMNVVFEREA